MNSVNFNRQLNLARRKRLNYTGEMRGYRDHETAPLVIENDKAQKGKREEHAQGASATDQKENPKGTRDEARAYLHELAHQCLGDDRLAPRQSRADLFKLIKSGS
jgi:hypothetical protein